MEGWRGKLMGSGGKLKRPRKWKLTNRRVSECSNRRARGDHWLVSLVLDPDTQTHAHRGEGMLTELARQRPHWSRRSLSPLPKKKKATHTHALRTYTHIHMGERNKRERGRGQEEEKGEMWARRVGYRRERGGRGV